MVRDFDCYGRFNNNVPRLHAKSERTPVRAPYLIATNTASVNVCLATYNIAHQMAQQLSQSLSGVVKVFLSQFICPVEQTLSNDWGDRCIIPVFVLLHHLLDQTPPPPVTI